jgi:hypothetical protein
MAGSVAESGDRGKRDHGYSVDYPVLVDKFGTFPERPEQP